MQILLRKLSRTGDGVSRTIVRGGLVSFGVRAAGLALGLCSHVLLSRALGANDYGLYAIAIGWCMILVIPAKFGLDHTALRYASVYVQEKRMGLLKSLVFYSTKLLFFSTALIGAAVFAVAWLMPNFFGVSRGVSSAGDVGWLIVLISVLAFLGVFSAFFRAAHKLFASQFYEQVLRSAILIAALVAAIQLNGELSLRVALMLTALSALGALAILLVRFRSEFFGKGGEPVGAAQGKEWLNLAWPVFGLTAVQQVMLQSNVILLGWLATSEAAGHYAAASRLASFVPFALAAVATVSGPMVAKAFQRGDVEELRRIAVVTARIAFFCAIGMSFLFLVSGKIVLSAFGKTFVEAYPALLILLCGGLVNAFTGSVGHFLTMTNKQLVALGIMLVALVLNLILSLILIPAAGLIGGAAASAIGVSVWNLLMIGYVRKTLGIDATALGLPLREEK